MPAHGIMHVGEKPPLTRLECCCAQLYFPNVYDIKYLMKFCGNLHGGLSKLAETLRVERIGPQHQAGSDSLLTSFTFLKLTESLFQARVASSRLPSCRSVLACPLRSRAGGAAPPSHACRDEAWVWRDSGTQAPCGETRGSRSPGDEASQVAEGTALTSRRALTA